MDARAHCFNGVTKMRGQWLGKVVLARSDVEAMPTELKHKNSLSSSPCNTAEEAAKLADRYVKPRRDTELGVQVLSMPTCPQPASPRFSVKTQINYTEEKNKSKKSVITRMLLIICFFKAPFRD